MDSEKPPDIRYRDDILERFIPIGSDELCAGLREQAREREAFGDFCRLFLRYTHTRLYLRLNALKNLYQPFCPDTDTLSARTYSEARRTQLAADFLSEIRGVLNDANFEELAEDTLNQAMSRVSPHGIETSVDFDEFEQVAIYCRGAALKTWTFRSWKSLWLRGQSLDLPVYRRLFVLIKFKEPSVRVAELVKQGMTPAKAEKQVQRSWRKLPGETRATFIYLKVFKDMPDSDLEMLFPNVRIHLKLLDKIKLGITGGGGTVGGIFATVTKLSAALNPMAIATAIAGLAGVIARQVSKLFYERTKYMMTLAQHLYFHNLSNNRGVLAYLLDLAEDEENKEALLAYYFLLHADRPLTREDLDHLVEQYIHSRYQVAVDFEVRDGLRKLAETGLLRENKEQETFSVLPLDQACVRLRELMQA